MELNYENQRTRRDRLFRNPAWWKRNSAFKQGFMIIAFCGILLPVASARSFGKSLSGSKSCNGAHKDVCTSPECIHTASQILKNMDTSVDPCDDFYRFTCGGFINRTIIPDDQVDVVTFSIMHDQIQEQLRKSIEDPRLEEMIRPFRLVKTFYKSCMNKSAIEDQGVTPLLNIIKELGSWPVLEGDMWKDDDFSWITSAYNFRKLGFSVNNFLDLSTIKDYKNSTKRVLDVDQAVLGLPQEYLSKGLEDDIVKGYYRYMVNIAVILGAERERAEQELMESLKFEIKLANIYLPSEKRRNALLLNNPITLAELSTNYSSIPWKEYLNTLLKPYAQVDDSEIINVSYPPFISELEELIKLTPKRVQANYAMWRAVAESASYLNDKIRQRQLEYTTVLNGQAEREPRWKECVDAVSTMLPNSVGALYVRKYFHEDAKKNVLEMVSGIQKQFNKILETVDWMDEETRKNALDKAASMTAHIAYPDELLQDSILEEFYEKLNLQENGSYLQNGLNLKLFKMEYTLSKLRKLVDKNDWVSDGNPAVVNAFYSRTENNIHFPAGILQGTFFNNDRPKYMNYGGIGFVIGHEITHGFDDIGRQFDKDGNLVDWWASSTKEKYLKKADCIINQYGNYTAKEVGMNLNGINTQGENIADNGAIKEAYFAYKDWADRNEPEPKLPGLPYTPSQMFWISTATTWCLVQRPETLKQRITTGVHSPGEFRVLGPISNIPEFAADFQCPLESRMNPKHKCAVW